MAAIAGSGALLAFLSVAFGAFAAHGLRRRLPAERLAHVHTGAQYQMYHGLAMILAAALPAGLGSGAARAAAGWLFAAGAVLFSGSLYALALSGARRWGAVTPLGGLCFLAGWATLLISVWS